MLLEQEGVNQPETLFLDQKHRSLLRGEVLKAAFRFPRLFNRPLYRSFELLVVNSPPDFLSSRTNSHLRLILCAQFFLQKKIEAVSPRQKQIFLKMFRESSRICLGISSNNGLQKEAIFKALDALLPGISEIPNSFYLWQSPEKGYTYCYFEFHKLRGKELTAKQLRTIQKTLAEQMMASSPLTPAVFWPYNKEESHRQIQLLLREMQTKNDLPHVSIQFQEQTATSLEFLIHLVRPKASEPLAFDRLPESLYLFRYSQHQLNSPFVIEIESFSIKLNAELFAVQDTINLLYARRYLVRHLETILGPFRDFNGGLFEKQQDHFEMFRFELSAKIPYFDLFGEKLFYALHPFERWLSLSMAEVEELFLAFSKLIQDPRERVLLEAGPFTVVKTENRVDFLRSAQQKVNAYAKLTLGSNHYECFSGPIREQIESLLQMKGKDENTLRLIFQEGSPPSLNPHYSSSDMRSRILNKMVFEGLTRLNEEGNPELAGAANLVQEGLIYTFQLRKAYWSNGEKVTAFDYAESWRWALQDSLSHPELLFSIKNAKKFREKKCLLYEVGIKVPDPETIQIELEEPDPQFLNTLSQPFFFPLFGAQREPKWFNGPYLLQEWKKNGIKLTRNPYYWRKQAFEHVEIEWKDDIREIYSLFQAGKVDWIGDPVTILSIDQIRELEKKNQLQAKLFKRRFSLHFHTKHPILSSPQIRQALSLAIDRETICKEIFPHSIPVSTDIPPKELAAAYFEEGLRKLGLTRENFPTLTFSYSDQTRRDELAAYLQKTWEETFNIQIELEKLSWNAFRCQLEKGNYEICGTILDTTNERSLSYLERLEGPSSWNFSQWTHLVYRELLSQAKKEKDLIKQRELMQQAENVLAENIPFTPLFNYVHLYAVQPRFDCSSFDPEGCVDFTQGKSLIK